MVKPKISVIIPCYNVEEYVYKSVKSIAAQDYGNVEIICINDGSTDSTPAVLIKLQQEVSSLEIVNQTNKGLSETRNVGIEHATGEYIMFVDSDDWLENDAFKNTFETGYDLIIFSYNRIFTNSIEPRVFNLSGVFPAREIQRRSIGLTGHELRDPSQANSLASAWGKFYKTSIIKNNHIKFVDTRELGTEDALFNLQYLEFCEGSVKIIDKPFYNYLRSNVKSLTSSCKPKLQAQWKELHRRIASISKGKGDDFEEAYNSRIVLSLIGLGLNEMARNDGNLKIFRGISEIITDEEYKNAVQKLNIAYMPLHWKVLFTLAKYRSTVGVFVMMKLMSFLLRKKNS